MAFRLASESPNMPAEEYLADASVLFTVGSLVYRDTSTGELKEATSTVGDATNIEGITTKTETTAASSPYIRVIPIVSGSRFIADCTNATAEDQLNKAHLLTDARTVNNTNTHSTDVNAIFIATRIVGASTDKKLYGYIAKLGQVTA